jgi:membrane associated rhomboid family serine protease
MLNIPSTRSSPQDIQRIKKAFITVLSFVVILWLIELMKIFTDLHTFKLGLRPDAIYGLIGVFTAPLIHSSFEHLTFNTPAILILGTALLYGYPRSSWIVLSTVWLVAGIGVWFTGRPVYHFGASGLTYGVMAFIFVIGIIRRDKLAIALSLLVFFLYGTMIWGVFPHQSGVSYETHLWGAGLGTLCAILLRNRDPAPPVKRYAWEDEDQEIEDPILEDAWRQTIYEKEAQEQDSK